jgi:UDP-glucose 6-dehydrogenase
MAQSKIMDYRQIQKLLSLFPIENEMTHIALDGNFGFGGKCLPKDLDAFNTKLQNPIITELLKYNLEIRK